jgi:hypothetical protein
MGERRRRRGSGLDEGFLDSVLTKLVAFKTLYFKAEVVYCTDHVFDPQDETEFTFTSLILVRCYGIIKHRI